MKRKLVKVSTAIIVIFVCLILGFISGILLKEYVLNTIDKVKNIEWKKEPVEKENISFSKAEEIIKRVFDDYYPEHIFDIELNNDFKTFIALQNTNEDEHRTTCSAFFGKEVSYSSQYGEYVFKKGLISDDGLTRCTEKFYNYSEVNKNYKKLFGKEENASKNRLINVDPSSMILYYYKDNTYSLLYDEEKKVNKDYFNEIIEAYKKTENDKIYITVIHHNIDNNELELLDGQTIKIEKDDNLNIVDMYGNLLKKYELVFSKYNKEYVFDSIKELME